MPEGLDGGEHTLRHLGDRPTLRTILWSIGFAINTVIFFLPLLRSYMPA